MTKRLFLILPLALALALPALAATPATQSDSGANKSANAEKNKSAKKSAVPKGLPADAVRIPGGRYGWTDAKGAKWVYVPTPFGWRKTPDPSTAEAQAQAAPAVEAEVKVTDFGDELLFESQTAFGVSKLKVKKSELTEEQKELWEKSKKKKAEKES